MIDIPTRCIQKDHSAIWQLLLLSPAFNISFIHQPFFSAEREMATSDSLAADYRGAQRVNSMDKIRSAWLEDSDIEITPESVLCSLHSWDQEMIKVSCVVAERRGDADFSISS